MSKFETISKAVICDPSFHAHDRDDDPIPYETRTGLDGKLYAVFRNSTERDLFAERCPDLFKDCVPACFGQYDNAFRID